MKLRFLYVFICFCVFGSCSKHYLKQKQDFQYYSLKETGEHKTLENNVAGYKTKLDEEIHKVIGSSAAAVTRSGDQSPLGNFVCDAMKHMADSLFKTFPCDMIIMNRGGLRADLPEGTITVNAAYEVMPFENELVLLAVKGEKLLNFIPLFEQKKHAFYGASIVLQNGKVTRFLIGGQQVDNFKTYYVLTNDFIANGGDQFSFLQDPLMRQNSGFKLRDVIIDYCLYLTGKKEKIIPYTDGRIELSK